MNLIKLETRVGTVMIDRIKLKTNAGKVKPDKLKLMLVILNRLKLKTHVGSAPNLTPLGPEQDILEVEFDVVRDVRHLADSN